MGLDDARRRRDAANAAHPVQPVPRFAEYYRDTVAAVDPLLRRTATALRRRVPEVEYRQRFEAEREQQFQLHRRQYRKARRRDFESRHRLGGSHEVTFRGDGPGGVVRWVHASGLSPYAHAVLGVNLDTGNWILDEHAASDRIGQSGPAVRHILSPTHNHGDNFISAFIPYSGENDRRLIDVIEEMVVVLIDYYGIPQSEVES